MKDSTNKYPDDFIIDRIEEDKVLISKIRSNVNDWCRSVKNNPFDNIGDGMNIKEANVIHLYSTTLNSQFDIRTIKSVTSPYNGGPIPPFKSSKASDYNVWNFNLHNPENFTNNSSSLDIAGSQHQSACNVCNGAKKVTCSYCKGSKTQLCTRCNGSGYVPRIVQCPECYGKGSRVHYVEKRVQAGYKDNIPQWTTKTVPETKVCYKCKGAKTIQNGHDKCPVCHGSGHLTCPKCNGSGTNTCPTCSGSGLILKTLVLQRDLSVYSKVKYNTFLSDSAFSDALDILCSNEWTEIDRYTQDEGAFDDDFTDIPKIGDTVQEMVNTAHQKQDSSAKLLFEEIVIERTEILKIDYEYDGTPYTLYVTKGGSIISFDSPITEYGDELMKSAKKDVMRRWLYSANKKFNTLYYLSGEREDFNGIISGIKTKMRGDVLVGSRLTMVAAILLLIPINIYYCNHLTFVASWVDLSDATESWIWRFVPYIYSIISPYLGYLFFKKVLLGKISTYIPTFILRFTIGVVSIVLMSIIVNLLIFGLHYIILPTIWETIAQIIYAPWAIIKMIFGIIF